MHDLTFSLMEHLGLVAILEDKARIAELEAHAAARTVDLTKAWMSLAGLARASARGSPCSTSGCMLLFPY